MISLRIQAMGRMDPTAEAHIYHQVSGNSPLVWDTVRRIFWLVNSPVTDVWSSTREEGWEQDEQRRADLAVVR